jgi:phage-related minor tail protein
MPEIGGVTIAVSAETADAQAGIRGVRDQLEDLDGDALTAAGALEQARRSTDDLSRSSLALTGSLSALSGAASRADDTIEESGDSAVRTAASFSLLGASANAAVIDLGLFNVQLTATTSLLITGVLAALTAVGTALVGVLGAIGAVAGAFGLLLGAGLVTEFDRIRGVFQRTIPLIKDALQPLGEVFGPLLVEGIKNLDELVENIVTAVGGTESFSEALRDFGSFAFDVIPDLVGVMFRIAREALPVIQDAFDRLNAEGVFATIANTTRRLLPVLSRFGAALARVLPGLIAFGAALVEVFLPPITLAISAAAELLNVFSFFPAEVQTIIVVLGALAVALSPIGSTVATIAAVLAALTAAIKIASAAVSIFNNELGGLSGVMERARDLGQALLDVIQGIASYGGTIVDIVLSPDVPNIFGGGDSGGKTEVNVENINAGSRSGGQAAARGVKQELQGNTLDSSRGG